MKKLGAMVLTSMLAIYAGANDLAGSFKQAVTLAEEQDKNDTMYAYGNRDLAPNYQKKYYVLFGVD